jgi:hypothetical protein
MINIVIIDYRSTAPEIETIQDFKADALALRGKIFVS